MTRNSAKGRKPFKPQKHRTFDSLKVYEPFDGSSDIPNESQHLSLSVFAVSASTSPTPLRESWVTDSPLCTNPLQYNSMRIPRPIYIGMGVRTPRNHPSLLLYLSIVQRSMLLAIATVHLLSYPNIYSFSFYPLRVADLSW
ncbi:hypothetical protein AA313_de0201760 [Arthrobotrys entomopaga]|nr:hypothetical protein AA313_de0201760 [Arthrobotrys entomopaga]